MTEIRIEQVRPLGFGRYEVLMFTEPQPLDGGWFGWITVVWGFRRARKLADRWPARIA